MAMRSRHLSPAALAVLLTLLVGGVAHAAWVASGSGTGAARSASLVVPALTAAKSVDAPTTSITLGWTDAGQLPGVGYEVRRGTTLLSCTTSPCVDTGLNPATQYSYTVTARLGTAWAKESNTATATTDAAATAATKYQLTAPATVTAGQAFTVTITAQRPDGTTDAGYTGSKDLTWGGTAINGAPAGQTPTLPASGVFNNGAAQVQVTLTRAGTGTLTVSSPNISLASVGITVQVGAPSRIGFTSITRVTGAALECHISCTVPNVGNKNNVSAKVSLTDAYGNLAKLASGSISVTIGGSAKTISPTTLTIVSGADTSAASTSANIDVENTSTLTAAANGYSGVTATLLKNN